MEKSSKRGKIPQADWPLIMARYEAGETLASIARTYDCSPPAISYVVSRSRARQPDAAAPPPATPGATEPQLVKAVSSELAFGDAGHSAHGTPAPAAVSANDGEPQALQVAPRSDALTAPREAYPPREANGAHRNGVAERATSFPGLPPRVAPPQRVPNPQPQLPIGQANGDQRRTLHLSLGQPPHGNGAAPPADPQPAEAHDVADYVRQPQQKAPIDRFVAAPPTPERVDRDGARGLTEMRPTPYQTTARDTGSPQRKDAGGAFIDKELRARVDGDIAAFLAAFDMALAEDTQESRSGLREATDRLLRAGARTRIELERLEARMPLQPHDGGGRGLPAWRHR
jgi:hypothetical protein